MRTLIGIAIACVSLAAAAHPSTGVLKDSAGNVYFTDLSRVWKIDQAGRRSVAVHQTHSHELALDPRGNLVGEDVQYLGGDSYRHRVWRLERNGTLSQPVPWTPGFWRHYGLVHNGEGTQFWVACPGRRCKLFRQTGRARAVSIQVPPDLGHINWLAAGPQQSVYFVAGRDIKAASTKKIKTFAQDVGAQLMGLHATNNGRTLFVAAYGDKAVYRLDGRTKTVAARSPGVWGPTGVWLEENGNLLLLEYSTANVARVRRVWPDGRSQIL